MGKKTGPKSPPPPDPTVVANAQAAANTAAAREQQRLNMIGTTGPNGTVNYVADETQPGGYRQVTSLSPGEQAIYDAQNKTELGATNLAYDQLGRVRSALETPFDASGLPELRGGTNFDRLQTSFSPSGQILDSFDHGQAIQGDVGGDLERARLDAQNAVYGQMASRLDPRFAADEEHLRSRLAAQGFSENSTGYGDRLADFGRTKNDAYQQALSQSVLQGENAAQGQFGRQLAQGQFHNQAAGQEFGQNYTAAAFANEAQKQGFDQTFARAQFGNAARGTNAGLDINNAQLNNTARQQGLQERAYIQQLPINELTGLLSLGQVGMPNGVQYTPSQVAAPDVTGAYALQSQAQQANANRAAQSSSGFLNGLFSLGSAAILSDRRLKTDIRRVGKTDEGLPIYTYRYKMGGPVMMGVMAQEVAEVRPEAVVTTPSGYLAVDYGRLA